MMTQRLSLYRLSESWRTNARAAVKATWILQKVSTSPNVMVNGTPRMVMTKLSVGIVIGFAVLGSYSMQELAVVSWRLDMSESYTSKETDIFYLLNALSRHPVSVSPATRSTAPFLYKLRHTASTPPPTIPGTTVIAVGITIMLLSHECPAKLPGLRRRGRFSAASVQQIDIHSVSTVAISAHLR